MHDVSPRHPLSARRRAAIARLICLSIALGSVAGLAIFGVIPQTQAAASADSSITIAWQGDTSSAASVQPDRTSPGATAEYDEFKNLKVTVSQTQNLIDQAIRVDVTGMPGGTQSLSDGTGSTWSSATNYLQAMQCYGDPTSASFRNTCQWGGLYVQNNNGLSGGVYSDNILRVAQSQIGDPATPANDVPFTTVTGTTVTGHETVDSNSNTVYSILDYFGPDTTNEIPSARIASNGTGSFDFEAESGDSAPQLGCGTTGHLNCSLVLVPRGSVYLGHDSSCSLVTDSSHAPYTYGRTGSVQGGSPINTNCDYWDNRIVVPLSFNPVGQTCPAGGVEQRVIGSQLLIGAMASWQPVLCNTAGATFSYATNPDSIARADLLENQAVLAFSSQPIVRSQLDNDSDQQAFDSTQLAYAPVAIGATTVAFVADGAHGRITSMVMSPRLLAKLLTQSYLFELPNTASDPGDDDFQQLDSHNRNYIYLNQDPDFQALNPNYEDFTNNPSIVLPGPSGADTIAQIWKWIQSDSDARAFLDGAPDPWGMKVNPYYLPAGNAAATVPVFDETTGLKTGTKAVGLNNVDGSPQKLSSADIDYFIRADQSTVPHVLTNQSRRFDSIQYAPYVDDYVKAAKVTFRANPGSKTSWNPLAIAANGATGDWVSTGPQIPGQRFVISISDVAAAQRYDLSQASLQSANSTTLTTANAAGLSAAISSGLTATANPAVTQVDPSKVSPSGYPLTNVVYAIVNLTQASADSRTAISKMIKYVTGDGQVQGTQLGQLPPGYLPLTSAMVAQSNGTAAAVASYVAPVAGAATDDGAYASGYVGSGGSYSSGGGGVPTSAETPHITTSASTKAGRTPKSAAPPVAQAGLGLSLAFGLIGTLCAPALFRGRGRL